MLIERADCTIPVDETGAMVQGYMDETLRHERYGDTPMPIATVESVTEETTDIVGTDDSQTATTCDSSSRKGRGGNRWFDALPSLDVKILVGLPGSLSDLWVNIPDVFPESAETIERRKRGYAQLHDPDYSRRLNKFLDDIKKVRENNQKEDPDAA